MNEIIAIGTLIILVVLFLFFRKIFYKSDGLEELGKFILNKTAQVKVLILEFLLIILGGIEALQAGEAYTYEVQNGEQSGDPLLRTVLHIGLSLSSAAVGFGIFRQVEEAIEAWGQWQQEKNPIMKKFNWRYFIFQLGDVFGAMFLTAFAPIITLYSIAKSYGQADLLLGFDKGVFYGPHQTFGDLNTTVTNSFFMVMLHICVIFYLSWISKDKVMKEQREDMEKKAKDMQTRLSDSSKAGYYRKVLGLDPSQVNAAVNHDTISKRYKQAQIDNYLIKITENNQILEGDFPMDKKKAANDANVQYRDELKRLIEGFINEYKPK
jgi:hypothetical protein